MTCHNHRDGFLEAPPAPWLNNTPKPEAVDMTAKSLRDLLQSAVDKRGNPSVRQLEDLVTAEERRDARGLTLNRTTANKILRGTYHGTPTPGTIRAIAWLAGVPEEAAFEVSEQATPGAPFAADLPPGVDALAPGDRRAAVDMLRALVSLRKELSTLQLRQREELVRISVYLSKLQLQVEHIVAAEDEADPDDVLDLSRDMGALANTVHKMALAAYSGEESELGRRFTQVSVDMRARDSGLAKRLDDQGLDIPDSVVVPGDGTIRTVGRNADGTITTRSTRFIDYEADFGLAARRVTDEDKPK